MDCGFYFEKTESLFCKNDRRSGMGSENRRIGSGRVRLEDAEGEQRCQPGTVAGAAVGHCQRRESSRA